LLSYAAQRGHEAIVELLLATNKTDVDSRSIDNEKITPLWDAAKGGHEAVVRLLLDTGKVDVDYRDNFCCSPLWHAAVGGHEAVVIQSVKSGTKFHLMPTSRIFSAFVVHTSYPINSICLTKVVA
jgi:hypothetical protein